MNTPAVAEPDDIAHVWGVREPPWTHDRLHRLTY